jgi:hypothetical protein
MEQLPVDHSLASIQRTFYAEHQDIALYLASFNEKLDGSSDMLTKNFNSSHRWILVRRERGG